MYYRIFAHVDTIEDSSYPRMEKVPGKKEKVEKMVEQFTFNLRIPGQTELTKVTIQGPDMPSTADREKWEDAETLVYVEADRMRTIAGLNDESAWGFSSFNGLLVRECTPQERQEITKRKKQIKDAAKLKHDQARREKMAAKKSAKEAA